MTPTPRATFHDLPNGNRHARVPSQPMEAAWSVIVNTSAGPIDLITVRSYGTPRGTVARVVIWLHHGKYPSGRGNAGGGNYDKTGAAFYSAVEDMGVTLSCDPDGWGRTGMERTLDAIVRAAGYSGKILHVTHGPWG